jgi:hypothetical protein
MDARLPGRSAVRKGGLIVVCLRLRPVTATGCSWSAGKYVKRMRRCGPQPHPSFIDFSCEASLGDGDREMARAGEDAQGVKGWPPDHSQGDRASARGVLPRAVRPGAILDLTPATFVVRVVKVTDCATIPCDLCPDPPTPTIPP